MNILESQIDKKTIWYFGNNRSKNLKLVPPKWYAPFFLTTDYNYAEEYSDYGVYTITLKGEAKSKILDFNKDSDVKKLKWPKELIDDIRTGKSDLNGIAYDMYILAGYGHSQEVFDKSWHLSDAAYDFDERSENIFDIVPEHANWASEKYHRFVLQMWKDIHDAGFDGFTHLEFGKKILALFDFKCMDKISIRPVSKPLNENKTTCIERHTNKEDTCSKILEESYQLDQKLWFHGTPKKRPLQKPSPLKPFYVTEDPTYAVLFSKSAENKSQSASNGFVYAVVLDASQLNIFDLNSKTNIQKLKLPKILEYYFTNIKLDAYNILCELLMAQTKLVDIGNKWLSMSNKVDADNIVDAEFKRREEKPETDEEWGEPEQPIIEFFDGNNHGFNNASAKEFLMWALHKLSDAGIKSIPYRTAFGSQDSNFTEKAYKIVAALVLDDVLNLGYNATLSLEEGENGSICKCIGIIDYDAIDKLSHQTLTIEQANQLVTTIATNKIKTTNDAMLSKAIYAVLSNQNLSEEEGISNSDVYLSNMAKSFADKAWFLKHIPKDITTIVDFGGGTGDFAKFCQAKRPDLEYVVVDNNASFFDQAKSSGFTVASSLQNLAASKEIDFNKSLLVLSSVIHEIYSYADANAFWREIAKCGFRAIAIRDMSYDETAMRRAPIDAICWVYQNIFMSDQMFYKGVPFKDITESFEDEWGAICNPTSKKVNGKNLFHFLIKYRYQENWAREVQENYLPVSKEKLASILTSMGYSFTHKESSKLEFYGKCWKKDFKLNIPDNNGYRKQFYAWLLTLDTHIKWFLEKTYSSKQNLQEDREDNDISIKQIFDEVVSQYIALFGIDLSYMTFKVDSQPVYTNGKPCYEYDEDECAGDWTSLGWIRLNPDMKSVMDRYGVDGDVSQFTKIIIVHELAHEVWNNIADDQFKEAVLDEARKQSFSTVYLDTVRSSKLAEETFCEYLAHKAIC